MVQGVHQGVYWRSCPRQKVYGFACQVDVPFAAIEKIEKTSKTLPATAQNCSLSVFDMIDSSNIVIYLNRELILQKIYGIEKPFRSISLFIDEKDCFVEQVEELVARRQALF